MLKYPLTHLRSTDYPYLLPSSQRINRPPKDQLKGVYSEPPDFKFFIIPFDLYKQYHEAIEYYRYRNHYSLFRYLGYLYKYNY